RDKLVTGVQTCALPICAPQPGDGRHGEVGGGRRVGRPAQDVAAPALGEDGGGHGRILLHVERQACAVERRRREGGVVQERGSGQIGRASCRERGEKAGQ